MKLGLLGGMFDPIHLGHLRAAENAREALALDQVVFVPAGVPPHRAPARRRPASTATRWSRLATAAHPAFVPSDVELRREGPSYTVDTRGGAARASSPGASVVLIVGSDNLPDDRRAGASRERLLALCTVAVVERPGERARARRPGCPPARVHRVEGPRLPIAASDAPRAGRAPGRSVRYLVPDAVADYIEKRGLYR